MGFLSCRITCLKTSVKLTKLTMHVSEVNIRESKPYSVPEEKAFAYSTERSQIASSRKFNFHPPLPPSSRLETIGLADGNQKKASLY